MKYKKQEVTIEKNISYTLQEDFQPFNAIVTYSKKIATRGDPYCADGFISNRITFGDNSYGHFTNMLGSSGVELITPEFNAYKVKYKDKPFEEDLKSLINILYEREESFVQLNKSEEYYNAVMKIYKKFRN